MQIDIPRPSHEHTHALYLCESRNGTCNIIRGKQTYNETNCVSPETEPIETAKFKRFQKVLALSGSSNIASGSIGITDVEKARCSCFLNLQLLTRIELYTPASSSHRHLPPPQLQPLAPDPSHQTQPTPNPTRSRSNSFLCMDITFVMCGAGGEILGLITSQRPPAPMEGS